MDWNRRWAKKKWLLNIKWHKAWANNVEKIIETAIDNNIEYLTLWALSKENLIKRDPKEIQSIIKLINNIETFLSKMIQNWLKFETIWDISLLPKKSQIILNSIKEKTKNNTKITLILALVYSWKDEIIRWLQKINQKWIDLTKIDSNTFKNYLDTANFPDPDLIIRTGWVQRHSWFLLYTSEYSEYYFSDLMWPDFNKLEFQNAINLFKKTQRRFWWN